MTDPNLPMRVDDDETGLGDFKASRMVIPRLTIDHKSPVPLFRDSLTGEEYERDMDVVILSMVAQRILWHVTPGDKGELPLCKSPDDEHGFPTPPELLPRGKEFPWEKSGFDPKDYPADEGINGLVTLSCANCGLAKWESHPLGKKPYCSEMYTFPVMYTPKNADPSILVPALFSVRSTGLRPANAYLTRFASTRTPMYTVMTRIHLDQVVKSGNTFCVPAFRAGDPTDRDRWPEFVQNFRAIRETIRRAPTSQDEDPEAAVSVPTTSTTSTPSAGTPATAAPSAPSSAPTASAPAATASRAPAATTSTAASTVAEAEVVPDDEELPF
jgi:hypothetical protein